MSFITTRKKASFSSSNQGGGYDPDAQAYFDAAGITDTIEKDAVNTLILGLKTDGIWTKLSRLYLRSPTSFTASLICCKTLTSQTAVNMTDVNWAPESGLIYNGTTQYARCDAALNTMGLTSTNGSAGGYFDNNGTNGKVIIGCKHSDGTNQMFVSLVNQLS